MEVTTTRLKMQDGPPAGRIWLIGELDVATCEGLDARLRAVAADQTLSLDLSKVTFVDSSGLRVLIQHHTRFVDSGGRLTLVNPSTPVSRLLEIAGLTDHLDLG
jgi:anti-sigma B factor antagonist